VGTASDSRDVRFILFVLPRFCKSFVLRFLRRVVHAYLELFLRRRQCGDADIISHKIPKLKVDLDELWLPGDGCYFNKRINVGTVPVVSG
jgi:hypothetical protein